MNGKIEARINMTGRVQGVGFRPFIYRMAVKNGLLGYVINLGDAGVQIIVEGTEDSISRFLDDIRENAPEVSDIEDILHAFIPFRGRFDRFIIDKSKITGKVASGIYPPDIGICPECLRDIGVPKGRTPDPIDIPTRNGIGIALGAELRNATAIGTNGKVFMTQYLGDITILEASYSEKKTVQSMRDLLNITRNADVMACDLHPDYMTSQMTEVMSQEMGVPLVRSQHHHAHITSVMAENGIKDE